MIVADASVILKWVLMDESDREEALALRKRHLAGEDPIAAPDLLLYEVANVLPLKREDAESASEGFQEICSAGLRFHEFGFQEFRRAMGLALQHRVTTYDASYLVLAQALHCRFVTADEKMLARLKGVPHVIHLTNLRR